MSELRDLRDMTQPELKAFVTGLGAPAFRGAQVFEWIYKGKTDFREITVLPEALRSELAEKARIGTLETLTVQKSRTDGTRKYLFGLEDGNTIESVFMKYKYGDSICVSSQAGCRMGCAFCASTRNGLARDLTAGEIVSQILAVQEDTGERISHVVIMGSGEPFDNYGNVARFLRIVNDPKGLGLGMRNITVSTCGVVPMIPRFAEDFPQVNLAISLHAPNDEIRSRMMPVDRKWPIPELLAACRDYADKTGRRVTFEYTLVAGVNDADAQAEELAALLRGMLCHVNLIPLNEVRETGLDTVPRERAEAFRKILEKRGIPATIRRELGADIDAACGQLRLNAAGKNR